MTGTQEARAWLQDQIMSEWALLFLACWWHEARRGGIGVIVPSETVGWLEEILGDIPIDPNSRFGPRGSHTNSAYILERMRGVLEVDREQRNEMTFTHFPSLAPSWFVWTGEDGRHDRERPGARRVGRTRQLRFHDRPRDREGRLRRVDRWEEIEEARRREGQAARQRNRVLGRRGREEWAGDDDHRGRQRQRVEGRAAVERRAYEPYYGAAGQMCPNAYQAPPIPEEEWGVHARNHGDVDAGYADPEEEEPELAAQPTGPPPPDAGYIRQLRERIRDIDAQIGPVEYIGSQAARRARDRGRRQHRGRLRGAPPGLFADGNIPRRQSRLDADRQDMIRELEGLLRAQDDARRRGHYIPDPDERNPEFHPWHNRRHDDDYDGGGGGVGGGDGGLAAF